MPFSWSLNPYVGCAHRCTFCYVRGFERRADRPSDERYGRTVRVKGNIVGVLREELARRSWRRETVCVGTATDPYQPVEGTVRLTRGCLEAFADFRTPIALITRGPLIVRDIDVLVRLSSRAGAQVCISMPSIDGEVVRHTEPGTAPPSARLRALKLLVDAGVRAGISMAPILPGISDSDAALAAVVRAARHAGATFLWAAPLNLRAGTREHFLEALGQDWPELLPRYQRLFAGGGYLPRLEVQPTLDRVEALRRQWQIADRRTIRPAPPPEPLQLGLAM
jgi:DNA repair photolyase